MIKSRINSKETIVGRAKILLGAVFVFGLVLCARLVDLQLFSASEIEEMAMKQHSTVRTIPAERGKIFFTDIKSKEEYPVATNRVFNHVFAVPTNIKDLDGAVEKLLPVLEKRGITEDILRSRLGKENDIYEPLVHKMTDEELSEIEALGIEGIESEEETWRYYPEGESLAKITGFVGIKEDQYVGQYGLEGYFEKELKGKDGKVEGQRDVSGRLIHTNSLLRTEPEQGVDLILTIDRTLQSYIFSKLKQGVAKYAAESGTIIVLDPSSGAVLAMASYPSFDPNNYNQVEDISIYFNNAVYDVYEPGSIFKSITMAAGIDAGVVNSKTTYTDTGREEIAGFTIMNSDKKSHGEVDMVTVLNESLNTGAIFVQRQLGKDNFREYLKKFGFGVQTGIELSHESKGDISSLDKGGDIYAATASFGHGISVTPLQIAASYVAIANGGKLYKPYIIKEKRKGGEVVFSAKHEVLKNPISIQSSTILSGMLVSVVNVGHAKHAGVKGYYVAGKTGTALVPERGGYGNETIHSFVGFAPVDNPKFVMLVKFDKSKNYQFAASTSAPLFGEIAKFILQYYEILPDDNNQ